MNASAQDSKSLLSFDSEAIGNWIEQKRAEDPNGFDQPRCLRSDAFMDEVSTSCLAQQAMFFLSEVNTRRMIEQKALRRTLKSTDDKRFKAIARAKAAEETLEEAKESLNQVAALRQQLDILQSRIEQSDLEASELAETNALLIEVYQSLTDQLRNGLLNAVKDTEQ